MEIKQNFVVAQPLPAVWDFFRDVPSVAACLPGAEYLGTKEDGAINGKVSAKVGPFQASFEGEARVKYDDEAKKVEFEGKGVDRKGASRGKMSMGCDVVPEGSSTRVIVVANLQLSGSIAQFGRTGLLMEIANQLVGEFARNAEAEIERRNSPPSFGAPGFGGPSTDVTRIASPAPKPLSATSLLFASLKAWVGSFFKKTA